MTPARHFFYLYRKMKIAIYPLISFGHPIHACRYLPTCSEYCEQSIARHGIIKGGWLCLSRLLRCHPLSRHSPHDPVP